uniref:Lin-66-like winged helix domain-containing protein n=1 Tax=Meloidogyne incognita TaxID=6306 RepID=A0A914NLU5_MELIC
MDVPLPSLLPGIFPTTNSMLRGSGILYWLSSKAGLINCSKPVHATVSFQIKDFCDSGVTDLTQYLRVGFRLAFHAIPNNSSEWIANYVSPISEQDLANGVTNDDQELNIESFESNNMPTGKNGKDTYSLEKEMRALSFLLGIFQKNGQLYIPLSNLHSRISNSGDAELSRYIGSSSLKRRQFVEDRSYIFMLADNDVVYLQGFFIC